MEGNEIELFDDLVGHLELNFDTDCAASDFGVGSA